MKRRLAYAFVAIGVMLVSALPAAGSGPTGADPASGARPWVAPPRISGVESSLAQVFQVAGTNGKTAAAAAARSLGLEASATRVRVVVDATTPANGQAALIAVGAAHIVTSGDFVRGDIDIDPAVLTSLRNQPHVNYVRSPYVPVPESVTDEAVTSIGAGSWHAFNRTGAGVKVAVIDLGFAGYQAQLGSVTTVHDCTNDVDPGSPVDSFTSTDHGTQVAAAVQAIAPDAQLYLICVKDEFDLQAAEAFVKAPANGIKIVVHAVTWPGTSRGDGTGRPGTPDAIVADAAANGVFWVNAAGNHAQNHWQGPWRDLDGDGHIDFNSNSTAGTADGGNDFTLAAGAGMCAYLKWDSWPKPSKDLNFDLFMFDFAAGHFFLPTASNTLQDGNQPPVEQLCWTNTYSSAAQLQLQIWYTPAEDSILTEPPSKPRFDLLVTGAASPVEYPTATGSIAEPADSAGAFAVGASCWSTGASEPYSSLGPTLSGAAKPDLRGPDSVSNFAGASTGCGTGFTGTSAAAAHVAGAAALEKSFSPGDTAAQLKTFLLTNAVSGNLQLPALDPKITTVTPTSGPVGTVVTINGTALVGTNSVQFGAGASAVPTSATDTKVVVAVPVGAKTGQLTVSRADGGHKTSTQTFTVTPRVTGFSPGAATRNTPDITITGNNFTDASAVKFNGVLATTFDVVNDETIHATVPDLATSGKISVTVGTVTASSTDAFVVILPPTLTTFTPSSGPVGTLVTLNGTNLDSVDKAWLNGGTPITDITHVSATQIKVHVPPDPFYGKWTVSNALGTSDSVANFTVKPAITSFDPVQGPRSTPTTPSAVTIHGTSLMFTTKVTFNGVPATNVQPNGNGRVDVLVPPTATTGKIAVTTSVPLASSTLVQTTTSAKSFTVILPPTVTSFSPTSGPEGTVVTLSGANLGFVTSATLNGLDVGTVTHSGSQLKVTVPAGARTSQFSVTSLGGTGLSSATSLFKVTPKVESFAPGHGPRNSPVTITGKSFLGASKVTFNGVTAGAPDVGFTVVDEHTITTHVPLTATTGKIAVTTPSGTGGSAGSYTVILKPTISSFTPAAAATGATVTVNGTNLLYATKVTFPDGVDAPIAQAVSQTQAKVLVPAGVAASGKLTVTNPADVSIASSGTFKLLPAITSMETDHGLVGETVVIHGTSFQTPLPVTRVTINGVTAPTFTVDGETQITVTVPAGATPGKIAVATANGTGTSVGTYTVVLKPTIASFTPASGPVGTLVTISGTNLGFATQAAINAAPLDDFQVVSATKVTGKIPGGAVSGKLTVTNAADTSLASSATFKVTPRVDSFTPDHAKRDAPIHITGLNFTGATAVKFNGATATPTNVTDSGLDATVPGGATTGKISVTTPQGTGTSAGGFNVVLAPTITTFTPASGPVGATVTVNGTNLTYADSVSFNGTASTEITHVSPTQLKVVVPDAAATGKLTVHNEAATSLASSGTFTVLVTPTVTGYDPAGGAAVGDDVTISGTNLTGGSVKFNGVAAIVNSSDATEITATVPSGATTGTVTVTVSGVVATGPEFKVLPKITGLSDFSAQIDQSLTITGTTFDGVTSVKFNGVEAVINDRGAPTSTKIDATVPGTATTGFITVTTPGGTATTAAAFPIVPLISDFTPVMGPVGTSVTITGGGFHGTPTVKFNGTAATSVTVMSPTRIDTVVPAGATTGLITVTQSEGTADSQTAETENFTVTELTDVAAYLGA